MNTPQRPAFCPECGHKLASATRFCPECGARIPDAINQAAAADQPVTPPTVVIPPDQAPAPPTVVIPPDQAPAPPTVVIPPDQAPAPPTPPFILPSPSTNAPPDPYMPPRPMYDSPAGINMPPTLPSPPTKNNQPKRVLVLGLIGGIGCLLISLIAMFGFIIVAILTTISDPTLFPNPPAASEDGSPVIASPSGNILARDDFENPETSELGTSNDNSARYAFEQGRYVIEVKQPKLLVWSLLDGNYRDVVIETSYSTQSNGPPTAAGLIFRYQDENNFYLFSVSSDGYYALELLENNQWITLIDWTQHTIIHPEHNRLRVELRGDQITLYVNDRRLEQTRDTTFMSGQIGLAVTSFDQAGALARYDDIIVRQR